MAQNVKGAQNDNKPEEEEDNESSEYTQMQQILEQFKDQNVIVVNLFKFMQFTVFIHDKSAANFVANYPNLPDMLLKSTAQVENHHIRNEVLKRIKEIIRYRSNTADI